MAKKAKTPPEKNYQVRITGTLSQWVKANDPREACSEFWKLVYQNPLFECHGFLVEPDALDSITEVREEITEGVPEPKPILQVRSRRR